MPDPGGGHAPHAWQAQQQISLIIGLGFSALLLLAGYIGASGEARLTDQYPWITLAALGVACSGVVHARWLLAGLICVRSLQRDVLAAIADVHGTGPASPVAAVPPPRARRNSLVTVVGASTYVHRLDCVMAVGKPTAAASSGDGGRVRCRLCSD